MQILPEGTLEIGIEPFSNQFANFHQMTEQHPKIEFLPKIHFFKFFKFFCVLNVVVIIF